METHLYDLAVRQTRKANVKVIVANDHPRDEQSIVDGVHVRRLAEFGRIASVPICPGLLSAIRLEPVDLVHLHTPNPAAAFAFLASGHPGPLVITHHADTLGRKFLRRLSDPFVQRAMHRASAIIVTSTRYLKTSEELAPFREKCQVVPLGISSNGARMTDRSKIDALHSKYGTRLIISVGRMVRYKGFEVLIRAMKHVDGHVLLIGSGPERRSLASLITSESLEERVSMLGRVDDLNPYLEAASLFVLPSITRAEAFGLVQLEAMAAGLPVVNTNIDSAVPEVSVDGETGITVSPGDATALAQAIELLLNSAELRRKYGDAARVKVNREYTAELMATRTLTIYERILGVAACEVTRL